MKASITATLAILLLSMPGWAQTVHIQAIRVSDDTGGRPANVTFRQMGEWVSFANRCFADAGIRFAFDSDDYAGLKSTLINNMTGTQDANWGKAKAYGNSVAAAFPSKIVVFIRHGRGEAPTGGGFSWWDYNFVVMPGFADASHCGHPHLDALAHEIGHYMGLPHTFAANPFPGMQEAEEYLKKNGNNPSVFDGDGFSDTPPDPSITPLECERAPSVVLNGVTFQLPRRNLMSYYDERDSLSPQQIARVKWILATRLSHDMGLPTNKGALHPIEAESMHVMNRSKCAESVQSMSSWGAENWSGGSQLFCGFQEHGSITLLLPVEKAGAFHIILWATQAPDFGRVCVLLDDKAIGSEFDAYAPIVVPSGSVPLGDIALGEGDHWLRVEAVGKNAASTGYKFGLDCVELQCIGNKD